MCSKEYLIFDKTVCVLKQDGNVISLHVPGVRHGGFFRMFHDDDYEREFSSINVDIIFNFMLRELNEIVSVNFNHAFILKNLSIFVERYNLARI